MADDSQKVKMAVIAGASRALKYKQEDPRATDTEIVKKVASDMHDILSKLNQGD
jgi:hypothetical protein